MDTSGHKEICKIGEELLNEAFDLSLQTSVRTNAFTLGNWLTDYSQFVDARTYKKIENFLVGLIDDVEKQILSILTGMSDLQKGVDVNDSSILDEIAKALPKAVFEWVTGADFKSAKLEVRKEFANLREGIKKLIGGGASAKESVAAEALKNFFHCIAFFKFVYLKEGAKPSEYGIDYDAFKKIMEKRFTQYLPHEHQDRPEVGIDTGNYDKRVADGPINEHDKRLRKDNAITLERDMYEYLRENILIHAGTLSEIDRDFAYYVFDPNKTDSKSVCPNGPSLLDSDLNFNLQLAKLGSTLHSIEDFFAHTIFVDMISDAVPKMGGQRRKGLVYSDDLARRKKRWKKKFDEDEWDKLKDEKHLSSGYFDFVDMFISILQKADTYLNFLDLPASDKTLGDKAQWVDDTAQGLMEYKYSKLFSDTLKLIEEPKDEWKNKKNSASELLKNSKDLDLLLSGSDATNKNIDIAELVIDRVMSSKVLKDLPKEIHLSFHTGLDLFARAKGAWGLYKTLKTLVSIIKGPTAWLRKILPDFVKEVFWETVGSYLTHYLYDSLGGDRIGSHSLIAKDNGTDLFYKGAMDCARSVHYYIMRTMTRHGRSEICSVERQQISTLGIDPWIDWLHLLEYFLDNPFGASGEGKKRTVVIPISILHTIKDGDNLETLAKKYGSGRSDYTWETIADANFNTRGMAKEERRRQINLELKLSGRGYLVEDRTNYAFNTGIQVIIPDYQLKSTVFQVTKWNSKHWWRHVVNERDRWKTIKNWEESSKTITVNGEKIPPHQHAPLPINADKLARIIDEGQKLKAKKLREYEEGN